MSLLFKTEFLGHPLHVLDIRGRAAFFAHEIGAAAGYLFGGDRFVTLLTREWAESLEDDDDVAFLTGREFERVKRETGLPLSTRERLILFAPGVRKALMKSSARLAVQLQRHLDEFVFPRVAAEGAIRDAECDSDGEPDPSPAPPPPLDPVAETEAFIRRCTEYIALRQYARVLLVHRNDVGVYLHVEHLAVEILLGRGLSLDPNQAGPAAPTGTPVAA